MQDRARKSIATAFATAYAEHAPEPAVARAQSQPGEVGPSPISTAVLLKCIHVIESIVLEETEALRGKGVVDVKDYNRRKSHALIELNRAIRPFEGRPLDGKIAATLMRLRSNLEENRKVLLQHIEAVREISTMLCDAIRDLESDGTYSRVIGAYGSD